jgi:uncharacterized protein (DUF433 family)
MTTATATSKEYITRLDYDFEGEPRIVYRLANTRISLDVVITDWLNGGTPEAIAQNYAPLPLEKVYGAITFYLANREMIDEYLRQGDEDEDRQQAQMIQRLRETKPDLYQRLMTAKQQAAYENSLPS